MTLSKQVVLGVEGGGTKTEWLCIEQSTPHPQILGTGRLPAANLRLLSDSQLEQILAVLPKELTHVGVFLAGCVSTHDQRRLQAVVAKIWPEATRRIGSDRDSGFAAAFENRDGITVIAGTGSAVTGRRNGLVEKAGGWGHLLGDIGGGYQLAVEGLRRTLFGYDLDRRISPLATAILQALCLNHLEELVSWVMYADKMSVAKLAPVIFEAARDGDQQMLGAIADSAFKLAEYTAAVARRLSFTDPEVALMGGLFAHHPEYVQAFERALNELLPGAKIGLCQRTGAEGALYLAAEGFVSTLQAVPRASWEGEAHLADAATEQSNPRSLGLEQMSAAEIVDLFISEESKVQEALSSSRQSLTQAIEMGATALGGGGRLFYIGAGTSGRLGVLDASEIPPTFGTDTDLVQGIIAGGASALYEAVEGAEDQDALGALAIIHRDVRNEDIVLGITASGRTPFVLGALRKARELGAKTILLSCNPQHPPVDAELCIDLATGPELLTGSTRLKAGTATKVALNMISTGIMVRLGKVHGNVMSNVRASNAKLRDRAIRAVMAARACAYAEAQGLLEADNWQLEKLLKNSQLPAQKSPS